MELESTCFSGESRVIYDIMSNILFYSGYVDVMSIRFVDKRCYNLTEKRELWCNLLDRDFLFLTKFENKQTKKNPEEGYNIIRAYIFEYIVKIEKYIGGIDSSEEIPSEPVDAFLSNVGINPTDAFSLADCFTNPSRDKIKIISSNTSNIMKSFDKKLKNVDITEKQFYYRPTRRQQKIYNSLIEWKEERCKGKISLDMADLICMDIIEAFDKPLSKQSERLINILAEFSGDLKYGVKLSIMSAQQ